MQTRLSAMPPLNRNHPKIRHNNPLPLHPLPSSTTIHHRLQNHTALSTQRPRHTPGKPPGRRNRPVNQGLIVPVPVPLIQILVLVLTRISFTD